MLCPICNVELLIADRQGIEIDYCAKCRGIWLDRGELDKLIERSAKAAVQEGEYRREYRDAPSRHPEAAHHEGHHKSGERYQRKRKSFLAEIFDFD